MYKYLLTLCLTILCWCTTLLAEDPNCFLQATSGQSIANYYTDITKKNIFDANTAISQLTYADLYRKPPFRITVDSVRLDAQGTNRKGHVNWQVQINNVKGHSTIAHLQIITNISQLSDPGRQRYAQRMARNALNNSLDYGLSYFIGGHCQ